MLNDFLDFMQVQLIGTVNVDLFEGTMPPKLDNGVMIRATGGPTPEFDIPILHPTVQVLVRGKEYSDASSKADAIRAALHGQHHIKQGTTYFYYIQLIAEGGSIGKDETGREQFALNFEMETRIVPAT